MNPKQFQDPTTAQSSEGRSLAELTAGSSDQMIDPASSTGARHSAAKTIRSVVAQRSDNQGTAELSQDQLADILTGVIVLSKWNFSLRGEELNPDEVAGPRGLLPALIWQVEKMHRVAYGGQSIGITYLPDAANTTIGAGVVLPQSGPKSPMALFAIEALHRIQEAFPMPNGASLDSMVREFLDDHDEGLVPWAPGTDAQPSLAGLRQSAGA